MRLDDKTAIVTGAGQGIGRATALALARAGAWVLVNDVEASRAQAVAGEIERQGGKAMPHRADVSKGADVGEMVEAAIAGRGRIDVLVNNAGLYAAPGYFWDSTEDQWDAELAVDLKGVLLCSKAVLPHMIQAKRGAIVSIASASGLVGNPMGGAVYAAAKAGVMGFTRNLACQTGQFGITVNCVAPGPIMTDLLRSIPESALEYLRSTSPLQKIGEPDDVAELVLLLASERGTYITGQCFVVDGGRTIL